MVASFVEDVTQGLGPTGNGAHLNTCNEHVAGLAADAYKGYEVAGTAMRDALAAWWHAPASEPTTKHMRLPCQLSLPAAGAPKRARWAAHHQCNPTCRVSFRRRRLNQECPCDPP